MTATVRRLTSLLLALLAGATLPPSAARAQAPVLDDAVIAWEEGRFPDALDALDRALRSRPDAATVRDAALLTGEYWVTTELAADGTSPRWGPGGVAAYEVPTADGATMTRVIRVRDGRVETVAELRGRDLALGPDRGVFLRVPDLPAFDSLRSAMDAARAARDFRRYVALRDELAAAEGRASSLVSLDLGTGAESTLSLRADGLSKRAPFFGPGGEIYVVGRMGTEQGDGIWAIARDGSARRLTPDSRLSGAPVVAGWAAAFEDGDRVRVLDLRRGAIAFEDDGENPALSADGSTVAYSVPGEASAVVRVAPTGGGTAASVTVDFPVADLALSPAGDRVVFRGMPREDWELFAADVAGGRLGEPYHVTREIQHDLFPVFLGAEPAGLGDLAPPADAAAAGPALESSRWVLGIKGEGRHRRSYIHDLATGRVLRLFHNNTIRTVAPEYEWAVSPDGRYVIVVAERDGDTISPERGIYLMDLGRTVAAGAVAERVRRQAAAESDLRRRGEAMFAPVADRVRSLVAEVSDRRIYRYAADLHRFGSKYITQPGNAMAIDYLAAKLREFGYEPELQWFEPRPGIRTANVIARLPGTVDPDLVYVVSSHFDSSERGPGADDNSSGTTALLEAARVMRSRPQPRTIEFAFFTGEEAGLYGSREYVRRAVESGKRIVGALNNDMVGWTGDGRLDNTIRYSNDGIRDIQHGAAIQFTDLITYDARYYKNTDAHAYYEAYGDIVGGIGSYPILANPHYHQSHDVLETITQQLVAEVSKTTVATLVLLASSPARVRGLSARRDGLGVRLEWDAAPESDVVGYVVRWVRPNGETGEELRSAVPRVRLDRVPPDAMIAVRAVSRGGTESWDRAVARAVSTGS